MEECHFKLARYVEHFVREFDRLGGTFFRCRTRFLHVCNGFGIFQIPIALFDCERLRIGAFEVGERRTDLDVLAYQQFDQVLQLRPISRPAFLHRCWMFLRK